MGFNSVLFITNDNLDTIDKHPKEFAREIIRGVNMTCVDPTPLDLSGRFSNFSIPYCRHADDIGLIAVGGNYAETVYQGHKGWSHDHHTKEGQVDLLKSFAESMGYSIRKKSK